MARVNGRMAHAHCRSGCCDFGEDNKHVLKEELALAADESDDSPHTKDYEMTDPDWDGKLTDWIPDDVDNVPRVFFRDVYDRTYGTGWYSEDCPPDCERCQ